MNNEVMYMDPVNFVLSENPKWVVTEEKEINGKLISEQKLIKGIPIDRSIAESISKLNKLGYRTKFCCEGHFDSPDAYIIFDPSVPLEKINNLLIVANMWELDKNTYKNTSEIRIQLKIDLFAISALNNEDESLKQSYEYFKRTYLKNLANGIIALDEYEFVDNGARPIVSKISQDGNKILVSGSIYIHNESIKGLLDLEVGDSMQIELGDNKPNWKFGVVNLEIEETERVTITCELMEDYIFNIGSLYKAFYNKQMLFSILNDYEDERRYHYEQIINQLSNY